MSETPTQKIQNDFDRIALLEEAQWDHNSHYHSFLLKQLPTVCESILEIGCGTGVFSRLLAERCDRVLAIDLSPKMIEVAQRQFGDYTNINFQVADILKWEFPVEQFDVIASIATVHHLPVENLLSDLQVALKPGGKLVILDLLKSESIQDTFTDLMAVPLNLIFKILKNKRIKPSPEALEAWREHGRTDTYLTLSQAQQIYTHFLPGVNVRRHLFWRYSVVWEKSKNT
ncbi:class I SAM-dependent methyltransferase [Chlorogloeopsis sp. ULAP01]|uniref:class I SAM-dependent methyltransferase n=1 Tax=Chlorogloeopsis sp. ULAP01 TaxID=3056483 RepID=UPI0025AABEB0|nr:class I SAM-dependent methyltransferase [Chlorogloeopsis sp. ULAP01]MDM9384355.1 class I SAM-dependent methyltransferase [Chlorogloeopsis sp. ULAP01]